MTTPVDTRARRPQAHERLIRELREEDAGFTTYREILLFAAAVGHHFGRRLPFTTASGDIRYETLTGPAFSETLINMIAADAAGDDAEILDASRVEERIRVFEEYANGGLEYIQEQVNVRHQPVALVVLDLVSEALSESGGATAASVEQLLGGVTWT